MNVNNSVKCIFGTELSATMTGSTIAIGAALTVNPVQLIFDNQGTVPVAIYVNGTDAPHLWRTFPAGEALILDLRGNHGIAANFTPSLGTQFYGNGASGVFSISYTSAQAE
jgi:hypothetical protein